MAHTMNEQVIVIPAGTGDTNIELILDAAAELSGWYRDGYKLYADNEHTMGIKFNWTAGSSSCRVEGFFNGSTTIAYLSSFNVAAGTTIRAHRSADESVTFVDLGNVYLCFVYALNEDGGSVLFQSDGQYSVRCGTARLTSAVTIYLPTQTTGKTYCITRFPDVINGAAFTNLYMVVGTASPAVHNQLVSFDGDIYRIVFLGSSYSTSMPAFAFPVSD